MNLYQLTPIAASVPRIVATRDEVNAMNKLLNRDVHKSFDLKNNSLYQMNENPVNVVSFDSLNEKNMITKSGMKRKRIANTSVVLDKLNFGLCFFQERFAWRIGSVCAFFLKTLNGFRSFS